MIYDPKLLYVYISISPTIFFKKRAIYLSLGITHSIGAPSIRRAKENTTTIIVVTFFRFDRFTYVKPRLMQPGLFHYAISKRIAGENVRGVIVRGAFSRFLDLSGRRTFRLRIRETLREFASKRISLAYIRVARSLCYGNTSGNDALILLNNSILRSLPPPPPPFLLFLNEAPVCASDCRK